MPAHIVCIFVLTTVFFCKMLLCVTLNKNLTLRTKYKMGIQMKNTIALSILITGFSLMFISCKKNQVISSNNNEITRLKRIMNSYDTIYPLCSPACPPYISREEQLFIYDGSDRLTQRLVLRSDISGLAEKIDTMSIFTYRYNDNSAVIYSYSEKGIYPAIEIIHNLSYDSQNRILKDSITNPQPDNNKVTRFTYLQDSIIQFEKQGFPAGTEIKTDTMIVFSNNIVKEKISGFISWGLIYTIANNRNPLSYVNNFSLLASDLKNASNSTLFMIYNPQYITYNITSETQVISSSPYTSVFNITTDSLDRVKSFTNSSNSNKVTSYEYY